MPKKKNFRKKNSKTEEILIGPEENMDMESSAKEMENSTSPHDEKAIDGTGDSKIKKDHDNNGNLQTKEEGQKELSSIPKSKRFSFATKKSKHSGQDHNVKLKSEKKKNKGSGVQRSSSLSLSNDSKGTNVSKIPRYHTLQPKGKHLSASCSNFNTAQSLSLSKDGRDNWRMSGLLDTVEKSNSMYSLNLSVNDEDTPKVDKVGSAETKIKVTHAITSDTRYKDQCDIIGTTNEVDGVNTRQKETSCNAELIDDVIVEEPSDDVIECDNEPKVIDRDNNGTDGMGNTKNILIESKVDVNGHTESSEDKTMELDKNNKHVENGEMLSVPSNTERYNLDDDKYVTIENLDDFVHNKHIELPNDIQLDDWLVLNLMHQNQLIRTW